MTVALLVAGTGAVTAVARPLAAAAIRAAGPAPTVSTVEPAVGAAKGGTAVTITGTGFTGATGVSFGSVPAASFKVESETSISATSPAGTGKVHVTVATENGTSEQTAADEFTYAPTVTELMPKEGREMGATAVTITGTGFTGVTAVKFGAKSAKSFKVESPTTITAESPAGKGTVHVTVTGEGGTSEPTVADEYVYVPAPEVTAVEPNHGEAAGGTPVTISGVHLKGTTSVKFGESSATSVEAVSETTVKATAPPGAGKVHITVTTPGGTSPATGLSEYVYEPTVTAVIPSLGPASGGTAVTITGTGFQEGHTTVKFGLETASAVVVNSLTSLTAVSPPGAGTQPVVVVTESGPSSGSATFTYVPAPSVSAVAPTEGPEAGGTAVTITGANLGGATAVYFGTTPATGFTVLSPTSIVATSPAGKGKVDVMVTTAGGTSATSAADAFTYNAPPAPPPPPGPPPPPPAAICTMKPIFLTVERKHKKKTRPKITAGQLKVTVTCSQSANVSLAGRLRMAIGTKPRHGQQRSKVYALGPTASNTAQNVGSVVALRLPLKTVVALAAKVKESVKITLSASNAGGTTHNAVSIKQLKL